MTEWPIVPDSKSGVRATVPGVQIPLSPFDKCFWRITSSLQKARNRGQHQSQWILMKDAALDKDPQSVIFKVFITVSHSLYQFHFSMESLGY